MPGLQVRGPARHRARLGPAAGPATSRRFLLGPIRALRLSPLQLYPRHLSLQQPKNKKYNLPHPIDDTAYLPALLMTRRKEEGNVAGITKCDTTPLTAVKAGLMGIC
ncbi:MAG TPA: hypothetical protein DEF68_11350 [Elusimicrobia bacterium]|nr:hypothetical protein [Elusimicrobiota bacterium]